MTDEQIRRHVAAARKAIARLSEIEPEIAMAKACGLDCQIEDERCQQMKAFLLKFNELNGATLPARLT